MRKSSQASSQQSGFTILEVLLATVIFGFAVLAIVGSQTSSRRNVDKSKKIFEAVQLAQNKMVELEIKYQKEIEKGSVESALTKEEGAFEPPFEKYKWKAELKESSLKFTSGEMSKLLTSLGMEEDLVAAQIEQQKLVLTNLNKMMKENFAELTVVVEWDDFGNRAQFPLVTHLIPNKPRFTPTANTDIQEK